MTQHEFIEITSEIEKFYEKELTTDQRKIWFDELKKTTKERYRQIARHAYSTLKFMPKLSDFVEINKTLPAPKKQQDDTKVYECNICNSTGIVFYTKVVNGYHYKFAARCTCPNGLKESNKIPTIDEVGIIL